MKVSVLKSKIHRAPITEVNLDYQGSLAIDQELMDKVSLHPYEKILVANLNNGKRFETYAIPAPRGSKSFLLNGAASHKGKVGDIIIIMSFALVSQEELSQFKPQIFVFDAN